MKHKIQRTQSKDGSILIDK